MRGARGLIVLLVLALPLFWFTWKESKKGPAETGEKKDKVFSVEADRIEELEIKSGSGERTLLRKKDGTWTIAEPAAPAPPDPAVVSGITSGLAALELQRVIEDNPSDVVEFGLAAPKVEVGFKSSGQQHRLQIGGKTPSGTDVYARLAGQPRVFLISSYLESTFDKGTFDLQDKAVLKLDREKVDTLAISAGGRETSFARVNGEWTLKAPIEARADFSAVDGLISRLGGLQMKSLVPEGQPAASTGLEKPAATVRVGSGSSLATLVLGATAGPDAVYARDLSRPAVFTVESSLVEDLKKDPSEYRQKDLFDARSFNTTKVEIVRNGQTTTFVKAKGKDKDGKETEAWRQTAPSARDLDGSTVEALLSAATVARASSFAPAGAKTGLEKPDLSIALTYDGNREERVAFARSGTTTYASRGGTPGAAIVEAPVLDEIVKALDAVK